MSETQTIYEYSIPSNTTYDQTTTTQISSTNALGIDFNNLSANENPPPPTTSDMTDNITNKLIIGASDFISNIFPSSSS